MVLHTLMIQKKNPKRRVLTVPFLSSLSLSLSLSLLLRSSRPDLLNRKMMVDVMFKILFMVRCAFLCEDPARSSFLDTIAMVARVMWCIARASLLLVR